MRKEKLPWRGLAAILAFTMAFCLPTLSAQNTGWSTESSYEENWEPSDEANLIAFDAAGGGSHRSHSHSGSWEDGPHHLTLRHTEFEGVGYREGYTSLDAFFSPFDQHEGLLPFMDVRLHVLNNGDFGANAGMGVRHKPDGKDWVWGANLFYDYRSRPDFSFHSHAFHQIGVGLEFFFEDWDVRVNGYIPVGDSCSKELYFSCFKAHDLLLTQRTANAMPGIEIDIGRDIGDWHDIHFYGAMSPYFYWSKSEGGWDYGDDAFGAAVRVLAQWHNVGLTAGASWDTEFDFNFLLELAVRFPRSSATVGEGRSPFSGVGAQSPWDRVGQRVQRNDLIVLQDNSRTVAAQCRDSSSCEKFTVYHVNNTGITGDSYKHCGCDGPAHNEDPPSADGTWERPFTTLAAAESASTTCDIIYVHAGDGTTSGMSDGITLKDYQSLLGAGKGYNFTSCQGDFYLPAVCPGVDPKITNGGGNGVDLANGNYVGGLWVLDTSGDGIRGESITNGKIICNKVENAGDESIYLLNVLGDFHVNDNYVLTTTGSDHGIFLDNDAGGGGAINFWCLRNQLRDVDADAIRVECGGTDNLWFAINDNLITSAGDDGIRVVFDDSCNVTGYLHNNKISGSGDEGICVALSESATGWFDVHCNHVIGGFNDGIRFDLSGSSEVTHAKIRNNVVDNVSFDGLEVDAFGSSTGTFCFHNNCVNAAGDQGFEFDINDTANIKVVADNNRTTNSSTAAVDIDCDGTCTFGGAWGHNSFEDTFRADATSGCTLNLQLIGNTASDYSIESFGTGAINFEDTGNRNTGPFVFTGTVTTVPEDSLNLRDYCTQ